MSADRLLDDLLLHAATRRLRRRGRAREDEPCGQGHGPGSDPELGIVLEGSSPS